MFTNLVEKQLDIILLQFVFGDLMVMHPGIGRRVRLLVSWVTMGCPSSDRNTIQTYGWVCTDLKVFLDREINWSDVPLGDPRFRSFALIEEIHSSIHVYLYMKEDTSGPVCDC